MLSRSISDFRAQLEEGQTSDRGFGLVVGSMFLVLGCLPLVRHRPPNLWMFGVGGLLLALGAILPGSLRAVKTGWLFVGFLLGLLVNPLVLGILFYGVFTPCGFVMRRFGGDPLRLRANREASCWRERSGAVSSMRDPF